MNGLFIYLENRLDIEKLKKCKVKIPDFSINEFNELFKKIHFKDCAEVFNYVNNLKAASSQNKNVIKRIKKRQINENNLIEYCPQCSNKLSDLKHNSQAFYKICDICGCKVISKQISRRKYYLETIHAKVL